VDFPEADTDGQGRYRLEAALDAAAAACDIGAVVVEPMQARGGIRIPPPWFLPCLRQWADQRSALLIFDEIYTGFGRTGAWFACEHSGVIPDLICLGKALTGGFPLSACVGRAQVMDALSSQANLAGYRAVIEAAYAYGKGFPMMMTAAGTVAPAKVFIMGVGVAGLQAIATARRLGAVVTATDVRPATKEQVESLGAKFLAVEDEEFRNAQTAGGYAKPMSAEYQAKQAALTGEHIKKQDIVITTALIPGRAAPVLVSAAQVATMKPGSVLIDLAVEAGGNVEGAKVGEVVTTANGVQIVGHTNLPGRIASDASSLYAKNLVAFAGLLIKEGALAPDLEDEILKASAVTHGGAVVHEGVKG
jgi:NAD(P) transhydrogenase subunit alpha